MHEAGRGRGADLLQDLHGELRGDGAARDELVERVGEGHADAAPRTSPRGRMEWGRDIRRSTVELVVCGRHCSSSLSQ